MPIQKDDWRLEGNEDLKGLELRFAKYKMPKPDWDHDHCEFCYAKLMEPGTPDTIPSGYVTKNLEWICPKCFDDLKDLFNWSVI
jgi:hypothetical protein